MKKIIGILAVAGLILVAGLERASAWKFAAIGDTRGWHSDPQDPNEPYVSEWDPGVRTRVLSKIAADIVAQGCEVVIFAGDLIMGGPSSASWFDVTNQYANWRTAMAPVIAAGIPVYPVRGNHEWSGDFDGIQWLDNIGHNLPQNGPEDPDNATTERGFTYSVAYNNALFIAMDEYMNWKPHQDDLDLDWLKGQLDANTLPHVFVFAHTPAFKVNGTTAYTLYVYPAIRDAFWKLLRDGGVHIYFCGHVHFYTRNLIKGFGYPKLYQVVTGAGGAAPLDSFSTSKIDKSHVEESDSQHSSHYGYNVVEIIGNQVTVKFRKLSLDYTSFSDGANDTFSYSVGAVGLPVESYTASHSAQDYDGDGKADLVLFDETTGHWTIRTSASGYTTNTITLGDMSTMTTPGDYDGDGKTDPAICQENSSLWTVKMSSQGYAPVSATLGAAFSTPAPGDYDGDGKADPCMYLESSGLWTVMLSGSGYSTVTATLGGDGWHAVPGDYDGDGKADPAVYEDATGTWKVMLSGSGYAIATAMLGGVGYTAVPGDFDGDRKIDPAVYQEAAGTWTVMLSASGYAQAALTLGGTGYYLALADYDGDGKVDPAVFNASTGLWTIRVSASGYTPVSLPN